MLKAKFIFESVTKINGARIVKLHACTTSDGDNQNWSKFTPHGYLELSVTNEALFDRIDAMQPGDTYYIDVTPVAS